MSSEDDEDSDNEDSDSEFEDFKLRFASLLPKYGTLWRSMLTQQERRLRGSGGDGGGGDDDDEDEQIVTLVTDNAKTAPNHYALKESTNANFNGCSIPGCDCPLGKPRNFLPPELLVMPSAPSTSDVSAPRLRERNQSESCVDSNSEVVGLGGDSPFGSRKEEHQDEQSVASSSSSSSSGGSTVVRFDNVSFELSPLAALQEANDSSTKQGRTFPFHKNDLHRSEHEGKNGRLAGEFLTQRDEKLPVEGSTTVAKTAVLDFSESAGALSEGYSVSESDSSSSEEAEWEDPGSLYVQDAGEVSIEDLTEQTSRIIILSSDEEDEESDDDYQPVEFKDPRHNGDRRPNPPRKKPPLSAAKKHQPSISKAEFRRSRVAIGEETFEEFNRRVFEGQLGKNVTLSWSNKLRTTAGLTRLSRQRVPALEQYKADNQVRRRVAAIELSSKVIDDCQRLRSTLLHEMCHAAAWVVDGNSKPPHGPCFKKWAATAMAQVCGVKVTTTHDYEIQYKYAWACTNRECGVVIKRHSRSVNVNKQVCGRCRSKLMEIEVPANKSTGEYNGSLSSRTISGHTPRRKAAPSAYNLFVKEISPAVRARLQSERLVNGGKVTQPEVMKECARLWREKAQRDH